jgi:hypothetical protein
MTRKTGPKGDLSSFWEPNSPIANGYGRTITAVAFITDAPQ